MPTDGTVKLTYTVGSSSVVYTTGIHDRYTHIHIHIHTHAESKRQVATVRMRLVTGYFATHRIERESESSLRGREGARVLILSVPHEWPCVADARTSEQSRAERRRTRTEGARAWRIHSVPQLIGVYKLLL